MSEIDPADKFPEMIPIKAAPPLWLVQGCGVRLYGKRDKDEETGTHVATWGIALLLIPILNFRAYRVAPARGGSWLFFGRVPLSPLAKFWNFFVGLAIFGGIAGVQISNYVSSPAYQARRQMAAAHKLVEQGKLADAANIYQTLAIARADESANAETALKDLLDNRCDQAPLVESAQVIACAAKVSRRGQNLPSSDVAQHGLKLAVDHGDADPHAGIRILDAVRPLVIDPRQIDERRLALLRQWAVVEPRNLGAAVPLASMLVQQNQLDEAKKVLLPIKDSIGDGEGARVLGIILGREGDYDGSYNLLWPYVKTRLEQLHAAEKMADDIGRRLWDREIKLLDQKKGPSDFYDIYESASEAERNAILRRYVYSRIKNDPNYTRAQQSLEEQTAVVPVALELGIVMLHRAQGQTDADARKLQLESAEKVFLAVGGIAGKSDEYRISLGQVYYWLGKQAEGRQLFDEFLTAKGRSFAALISIANRLRQLGDDPQVRLLAEEAYGKAANVEERNESAQVRAASFKDVDDQVTWLQKANTSNSVTKASLAYALGQQAFRDGKDDLAVQQFRAAIDAYAAMPRNDTTLNQMALCYSSIFFATGDRQSLERCSDYFQQAVDLNPSNTILLYNAGSTLLCGAYADILSPDIDLQLLHETGSASLLRYLYHDDASRDATAKRVMEHPGIARGLSFLEKVLVLSPKSERPYAAIDEVRRFTHDDAALAALEQRIRAANVDTSDEAAEIRKSISGERDAQSRLSITSSIKRMEDLTPAARAKGGVTAAVALDRTVEQLVALDIYGGAVDPQKAIALAEEAYRLAPSDRSSAALSSAHLFKASSDLRHDDPAFDAYCKKYNRMLGPALLLALVAHEPGPFQQRVRDNADVQNAVKFIREGNRLLRQSPSSYEWAWLHATDQAEAEKVAAILRNTPRLQTEQSIDALLHPASAAQALERYWFYLAVGKPEEAKDALQKATELGVPLLSK